MIKRLAITKRLVVCVMCLFVHAPSVTAQAVNPCDGHDSVVTEHSLTINAHSISYQARAGTLVIFDSKHQPGACIFYVSYERTDRTPSSKRPIAFLFNGGPGSSSSWLHMGAFGPTRVAIGDAKQQPPPPYVLKENQQTLLEVADLVFIDPVGSGFSHAIGNKDDKMYWGVDADLESVAEAILEYVREQGRWNSPKFLIGESYGTFRAAALVRDLQRDHGMSFNGLVLISTILNLGKISFRPGEDLPYILFFPTYAAVAWYHNKSAGDLSTVVSSARTFAMGPYADALMKGSQLPVSQVREIAMRFSQLTGIDPSFIVQSNLRVRPERFEKELLRSRGTLTGGLDGRFLGESLDRVGADAEYDPSYTGVLGAFAAATNEYFRDELKVREQREYPVLNEAAGEAWNWEHKGISSAFPGSPNTESDLAEAIVENPALRVEIESGLFDLVNPFLEVEHTVAHLGLPDPLRSNVHINYYRAGHMMYLHEPDLIQLKANISAFVQNASQR